MPYFLFPVFEGSPLAIARFLLRLKRRHDRTFWCGVTAPEVTHTPELVTFRTLGELSFRRAAALLREVSVGRWLAVAVAVEAVDWAGTASTQALSGSVARGWW